ncbi:hypothetical protein CkaCkLH20_10538 [Colletotrichum karsti]|uniref:A to I editase domain-containing protein n=1 Tax=Colletotrichum karsti TaxID=1095194 RepID=A0A9P6LG78_9PEZI|nr:uncharacterized protein CkaCkLH20_10538 [Colletotrichum karsti]KAF9871906.1 hypothetical protein CkaCkLH20_10538 [Colletotrichum karsti]
MSTDPNAVADLVLRQFRELPAKRKPAVRDNGLHEWVPLSGIVAEQDGVLTCLSLATGMKCLPASKLPQAKGNALHDWHAEVLAIRAFNRHLLDECRRLLNAPENHPDSSLLRRRAPREVSPDAPQPFTLRDDVRLHMYCSEAPCGDASMELTMAAQEDASPWEIPSASSTPDAGGAETLPGRAYFSQLGVVRRKPARGDAPPTMSKSCSDKIALKQCTSLLSSLTSLLVYPGNAYISSLVLPESQYSAAGCERAFSSRGRGRMRALDGREWRGGYRFCQFEVRTTDREFEFSRRSVKGRAEKIAASNMAAVWTAGGVDEGTMGGVLQGRKAFDARGASAVSRRRMWESVKGIVGDLEDGVGLRESLEVSTYAEVKGSEALSARREVKRDARTEALAGWVANVGDDDFRLT